MEESIHVIFGDKLDSEKSKLFENFADLEINLVGSGEKDKCYEEKGFNKKDDSSETIEYPSVYKIQRPIQVLSEDVILGDKT